MTLALTGTSIYIYYQWGRMTPRQARSNFVFTETNFYNLGNYQSFFLCPLSYENGLFFGMCLPGLFYAGMLLEKILGPAAILGAYLLNCAVSAGTKTFVHRQIGFQKV